jgi:hypothetical protein
MRLDRTILLPTDDVNLACRLLNSVVFDEDCIVTIVFGDTEEAKNAVVKADRRAGAVLAGIGRKVAWARQPSAINNILDKIQPGFTTNGVVAISVSLANKVADTLRTGETIDFARIEQLFLRAGHAQ